MQTLDGGGSTVMMKPPSFAECTCIPPELATRSAMLPRQATTARHLYEVGQANLTGPRLSTHRTTLVQVLEPKWPRKYLVPSTSTAGASLRVAGLATEVFFFSLRPASSSVSLPRPY